MPKNELLKAVNARLEVSLEYLDSGRTEDAAQCLRGLSHILPVPERRHIEAARNTPRHDQPDA